METIGDIILGILGLVLFLAIFVLGIPYISKKSNSKVFYRGKEYANPQDFDKTIDALENIFNSYKKKATVLGEKFGKALSSGGKNDDMSKTSNDLRILNQMKRDGLINDQEYERLRKRLLNL